MASADAAAVLALGRELDRVTARQAAVEQQCSELAGLLEQLATDVATLAPRAGPPQDEGVRSWLLTEDPGQAAADLTDLTAWLARVYLRYPDAFLPSCWLWHPPLIEELRWLRCAHREAYHDHRGSWQRAADWHDRLRPGATHRITTAYGSCELREHTPGGSQARPAPQVPLTDATAATATAWTSAPRQPPVPTELQLRQAQQHDDAQHRRGA